MKYCEMTSAELEKEYAQVKEEYENIKSLGLKLNMARGKPSPEQLALTMPMLSTLTPEDILTSEDGTDCRNYGVLDGIPEAKKLLGDMIGVSPENVIVYGNSSLNIMYDQISRLYTHGTQGEKPWGKYEQIKFLCPSPGYDRHFGVTEHFGFTLITVAMTPDGPDMDEVESLVANDESIKGIWCVPKYSNPQGYTYSYETSRRLVSMKTAAKDFRIFWDNAYGVHHLYGDAEKQSDIPEILSLAAECGNPDRVYEFCSTSKITFPGSGIAAIASSLSNITEIRKQLSAQTIGHDKINQLRHVRFLKNADHLREVMQNHADILRPKFEKVINTLESQLSDLAIGEWTYPLGGYFISFDSLPGCAKRIVELAKNAGMSLTGAGATYPYKKDPEDKNIRIAPSFPSLEEIGKASELFAVCVKLASLEKLMK